MKKRILSLLLALSMICALLVAPASAAALPKGLTDVAGKLVILHTNDTHGRDMAGPASYGTAAVAQLKKDLQAAGAEVLLLSAGDAIQGTPLVNLDMGATALRFMEMAGYDLMIPGNHEFDWGTQNLLDIVAENITFPILAANAFFDKENPYGGAADTLLFGDNHIFTLDSGMKVGVFGLDTPETFTKTHPDKVGGTYFLEAEALYAATQAQVDELIAAGCDLIIAMGHLGTADESTGNRSLDVIGNTTGIDLFIDGHSHDKLPTGEMVGDTLRVSAHEHLKTIGTVVYDPTSGSMTAKLLDIIDGEKEYDGLDETVNAAIIARNDAVEAELKTVIGKTDIELYGKNTTSPAGVRVSETNMGDFATDALLWAARRELGEDKVDAALTNGGGIRDSIQIGDITMKDMVTVFPFGNTLTTIEVTGAQLLEALEAATFSTPGAIGAFPQVSGISFTIITSVPYEQGEQYPKSTYYAPAKPGSRIVDVTVGGAALDLDKTYIIATNDFTAAGGDTYGVFKGRPTVNTGIAMEQALVDYMEEIGTIGADYAAPQGRIIVIPPDVVAGQWYTDATVRAVKTGLMTGTDNGFQPAATVTRATVFQTLYNLAGKPETASAASFTDVPSGAWFAASAAWAEEIGLADGTGDALFNGDRVVTRQEIATILSRYLDEMDVWPVTSNSLAGYADADAVAAWATAGMNNLVGLNVITGKQDNRLDPTGEATRGELAVMLVRYCDLEPIYHEFEATIAGDGHDIPVIITLPNGIGPFPGVVMLHGTGSDKHEAGGGYDLAAPALAKAGIASIRLDFMGNGTSQADYADYNFTTAVEDAVAAAKYLAAMDGVNQDAMGVMGWSQGGTIALLAAGRNDLFRAVVTWAGAPELTSSDAAYAAAKADGFSVLEFDWRSSLKLGLQWHEDVRGTDVLEVFAASNAPVLAINGAQDTVVAPEWADKIAAASTHSATDTLLIAGADHTFNIFTGNLSAMTACIDATTSFFTAQLGVTVTGAVEIVDKYGNITTNILGDKMTLAGFEPGDLLNVTFAGQTLEIPYGTNYSDVDTGSTVVRNPGAGRALIIAINMGNFAGTYNVKEGDAVAITMAEKGGYYAGFVAHQVKRTDDRADYASDEIFANFRAVTLGDIGAGKLYRSSSPVNNELGRAAYADDLIATAKVATVINLADNEQDIAGYIAAEGFDSPYYKALFENENVIALSMGVDFRAEEFQAKLAQGLKFLATHKGPYLIHCTEGKDRAGFAAALLEMLMGATADEIMADYLESFTNYYNVEGFNVVKGSEKYNVIGEGNIMESVRLIAGLEKGASLEGVDLVKAATDYLTAIGLTAAEISTIQANLK